ncbi:hypothetical protein RJ55_01019 [Drechmeria coniospora]|nr:hypothetical protein RJ55_01019 [Drechmeria coniospora]
MASAVADLEVGLQAMLNLKPPGVSGSRITSLTSLCVANIQSESVLIQKIYTHFKKAPGTHKLGVLYVVDSVTRKWLEQAKVQGQPVNSSAQDGTYAAGVHRVTELMPVLMNDIIHSTPDDQKEKIKKLIDIWEKGQTFPTQMLESFKEKLVAQPPQKTSTTPPGSPPPGIVAAATQNGAPVSSAPATANGSSILEALANIARQNTSAPPSNAALPAALPSYSLPPSASVPQAVASPHPQLQQQPPAGHHSYPPASAPPSYPLPVSSQPPAMPPASNLYAGGPSAMPGAPGAGGLDATTQQQIMLIKALADQGVPFDKIPALIQSMLGGSNAAGGQPSYQAPFPAAQGSYSATPPQPWMVQGAGSDNARDRGYQDSTRSPANFGRSRSRSPDRGWGGRDSPRNGRDRGDYGHGDDGDRNARRGNEYRQRSPQGRHGRSASPGELPAVDRLIEFDSTLPPGCIRVFSRTLFVGGVTCTEGELRRIFSRFGTVQTCIVNKEKRHAFVKMLTRKEAVLAKETTEDSRNIELPLRTRWGVGFGPRDCSDYSSGVSVIPISKLTEADRKWMLSAPYGGSGGRPIEAGMCVEEPDIEIGAGVSSKAISRRMQTDKGGSNGPKSTRHRDEEAGRRGRRGRDGGGNQQRRGEHGDNGAGGQHQQQQPLAVGMNPFGGMGNLPSGMPTFPAGYSYPNSGA